MTGTLIFEGPIEEFLARKDEFAGQHISVFDAMDTNDIDVATPNQTIRSKEHLEELLLSAQNSPLEPIAEDEWEYIRQEVQRRIAEQRTAK